ncbi:coiled-coil domain-containing protein 57-like [Porites lutea]|uniref:coiled-coil domain-containing protein 57-like n=1 Tax=Porites lutea TaxID=51062 RepID=UPI003CC5DB1D
MAGFETATLQELVQQKENEWREAQELQIKSLQSALKEKERQLSNEKVRFRKLKEDFEHNLKLLEERGEDQELQRYDALFLQVRNINSARDGEVSDLKIQLDELKVKLLHGEKAKEELQRHYQQRLREHQQELNQFRLVKENEVNKEREEFESFKRELQIQLRAAEEDVESQRQELMAGFDDALRKREHEFRKKADDLSNSLLASELKVKMLTKELELVRVSGEKTKDDLEGSETTVYDLEKQLKRKDWELTDQQSMHRAKEAEMEAEVEQLRSAFSKAQDRFQHKHAELDRYTKEKEQALVAAKESYSELERSLEEKIRTLQNQLETEQVECRRLVWANSDAVKERQLEVQRLQATIADLENKLDKQAAEYSQSTVARDMELEALRQQEEKMRLETVQIKEATDRYKKELTLAMEREASLERSRAQLEVDWQRRCEDTERKVYSKQEQLITGLTKQRDQSVALAQERERELAQRDSLIRVLTETRDQALATLQRHGLAIPTQLPSKDKQTAINAHGTADRQDLPAEEKIKALEVQNADLRAVIRQMRHDMEDLNNQLAGRPPSVLVRGRDDGEGPSVPLTKEYVESLEKEITELKSKNRTLRQRMEEVASKASKPPPYGRPGLPGTQTQDPFIQAHIKELNGAVGALRQEKLELSAQVKKHQATVDHLQGSLNQVHEEVRQKQLAVDQLQYELTTQNRRATDELSALKQRITELELQLIQTRREADEYFKSGLERNAEATSLGNQLSTLKVELASQGGGGKLFNPQASVVKQLQEEILRLRRQLLSGVQTSDEASFDPYPASNVSRLHSKLQEAARRISQLSQEKEQLIQMGNRLRAELTNFTGGRKSAPPGSISVQASKPHTASMGKTPKELKDDIHSQLNAVEKLQYQLTSHELQYAQRMAQSEQQAVDKVKVTVVSSSSDSNEDGRAPEPLKESQEMESRDVSAKIDVPAEDNVTKPLVIQRTSSPVYEQSLFTSSSEGQASLQEIWKMLDAEESFRSPTPRKGRPSSPQKLAVERNVEPDYIPARDLPERDVFALKGRRTEVQTRPAKHRPEMSKKASGKVKLTPKKIKVRNYNVKDD